ncbi:MAG: hypothetical protein A2275_09435 [Bacteroidetes bacterium RIFOXYA12_FULL_35_11]|nr:MAG: hypothetical protein A2X01_01060 [Bacteroidetes bacterium GWF2_35_48]OFY76115.1 MAG: hypothetical protein A2275_09435 [Bacteroidetes bacterium RIFOXYA12_FULL_35_11]OFY94286.1 MAG: hypothetical protein A2309_05795 [Bacteroidetes bacterium RIFOXYB2_FULL_35_7]OFZ05623.1 MAG: hypothetical protein A2491_17505 [Bacteroidetes bacterium RIFOXYC12_FULL_35_7]HBX51168.1 hypothetical protein [Bacteroidales bacterium]
MTQLNKTKNANPTTGGLAFCFHFLTTSLFYFNILVIRKAYPFLSWMMQGRLICVKIIDEKVFLFSIFNKGEKDNISPQEIKNLIQDIL